MKVKKILTINGFIYGITHKIIRYTKKKYLKTVKKERLKFLLVLTCFIGFFSNELRGQLGFCGGNSGEVIFSEDFGTGLTDGPELPAGTTTYDFTTGTPNDGEYTISSTTNYFRWPNVGDRTPNDTNGKCFIVNASFTAGEFYRRTVSGLCENTTYEFSSWLVNLQPQNACNGNGIPINVRFQIWDETDTNLLAQGDTGDIPNTNSPEWEQYALVFKTLPAQTAVILKMRNNSNGGCGNDLAIDDISFSSCGDNITLTDNQNEEGIAVCEGQQVPGTTLQATPDFSIFTDHAYQWQESTDQLIWTDIVGATTDTYTTPTVTNTTYYRAKVAEDPVNLSNDLCNVISDVFEILIVPIPQAPINDGDIAICENEIGLLTVEAPVSATVNWYNAENGGTLLLENSTSYEPAVAGTYYAESISGPINCTSATRTAVTLTVNPSIQVQDETISLCEGETTLLTADLDNVEYLWNTGETTKEISVSTIGEYTVEVVSPEGCSAVKTIIVTPVSIPVIKDIRSDGSTVQILLENQGDFEFALNDGPYQSSPSFENTIGGEYIINVRYGDNCGVVSESYIHVVIPKFFTPNSDGANDLFQIEGLELFSSFELSIFNRYGQLLMHTDQGEPAWDGTLSGQVLPEDTYWYQLKLQETVRNGYFSLKR